jgi:hypothetical protein
MVVAMRLYDFLRGADARHADEGPLGVEGPIG